MRGIQSLAGEVYEASSLTSSSISSTQFFDLDADMRLFLDRDDLDSLNRVRFM